MKTTTLALCATLAVTTSTAYADNALPQMNMTEDMITKEVAHTGGGVAPYIPIILMVVLAVAAAGGGGTGCLGKCIVYTR